MSPVHLLALVTTMGSVLQLHDASGTGAIEFENTATATIVGDVRGINSSVPFSLTAGPGGSACSLATDGTTLQSSCPILAASAQACDEPMDRIFYGSIFRSKTMCTGSKYTCENVEISRVDHVCTNMGQSLYIQDPISSQWEYKSPGSTGRHCFDPSDRSKYLGVKQVVGDTGWSSPVCPSVSAGYLYFPRASSHMWGGSSMYAYSCADITYRKDCGYKTEEKQCNDLKTSHMANSLEACGDLCASSKSCTAFTYFDQPPPGACNVPMDGAPIVGQCILYAYPKVGHGVSKIKLRGGPQWMTKTPFYQNSQYARFCMEPIADSRPYWGDYLARGEDRALNCAWGPGIERSWPQQCGIVTYRKRSAVLEQEPEPGSGSGEAGSGSGEAGSGSGEAGSGSGEAGSGSGEAGSGSGEDGPGVYAAPWSFVARGTC